MTYSPTGFQATHLWQRVCDRLGLTKGITATGGTTTTIVDTSLSTDYQDYEDFRNNYAFIRYDAGGAGAAPEGEVQEITDYTASTFTLTTGTFSAAIAAGDFVTIVRGSLLPLDDLKRLCNLGLKKCGNVPNPDTSLTTAASQTIYTVPSGVPWNRITGVQIPRNNDDSNDMEYVSVNFKVIPPTSVGGGDATIEIQQPESDLTMRLIWVGPHVDIFDYDDDISTTIPEELAVAAAAYECAWWKRDIFKDDVGFLKNEYERVMAMYPMPKFIRRVGGLPHWQTDSRYSRYSGEELENA